MIKNQWYAVRSSDRIRKGQVLGARRFGENLVFYRTTHFTLVPDLINGKTIRLKEK